MDKYIVEIDGKNICSDSDGKSKLALSVKADNGYAVFCTEIPLTPYTEPDLEQVRKEAYEDGHKRGLADAWEAARKICLDDADGGIPALAINDIFNVSYYRNAMKDYSASEAVEKIRQYEQEKEEIKVGDEVEAVSGKAVIIEVLGNGKDVRYMYPDASTGFNDSCNVTRTGRHFPEIAEVLQKMKETDNG